MCAEGLVVTVIGCTTVFEGDASYSLDASWASGATADVRVRVLLTTLDAEGSTSGYANYGEAQGTATAGGTTAIHVASYSSVPTTASMTGVVTVPTGYQLDTVIALNDLSELASMPTFQDYDHGSNSFTALVPVLGTGSHSVAVVATNAVFASTLAWRSGLPAASDLSFSLAPASTLTSPLDGATNVTTSTTFAVASTPDVKTFLFSSEPANPRYAVTTAADSVTIPDLAHLGLGLPGGADYSWSVTRVPGQTDIDEAGDGWLRGYLDVLTALAGAPLTSDGAFTLSESRTFSTP